MLRSRSSCWYIHHYLRVKPQIKSFWKAESYRAFRLREMGSSEFAVAKKTSKCNFLQGKHRIDFTIIASHSMVCNQIQRNVKNTRKIHQAHLVLRQGGQQNHNQSWWIRMETRGSNNWDFLQVFEWFHTASEWSKPGLQVQPIMAQAARTAMELDELMREASDREAFSADSPVNLFLSCRMPLMLLRHEENWTDAGFTLGWLLDYPPQEKVHQKNQKCLLSVSLPCLEARAPGTRRRVAIMEFDRRFLSPQVVQGDHARRSIIGHSRQGP